MIPTSRTNASRTLRRVVLLAVFVGGVGWLIATRRPRRAAHRSIEPTWPPLDPGRTGSTWVTPAEDGSCPPSHPVKANDNSGIYHVPGGRFYERTNAARCYARAADAETDGYRAAKA